MKFSSTEIFKINEIFYLLNNTGKVLLENKLTINFNEFLILMMLKEYESPRQFQVAQSLGISNSLFSQRLREMLKKKLIKQVKNKTNRKENFLFLTPKGDEIVEKCYEVLLDYSKDIFVFSKEIKSTFNKALDDINDALKKKENIEIQLK